MKQDEKVAIALNYGYTEEDAETWYAKYSIHQRNARVRGLESELSFEQYLSKAVQAGIDAPDGIGTNTGQFVLGRVGDVGNYTVDSCRFITTTQNLQEATENGRRAIAGPKIAATKIGRTKENHPGLFSLIRQVWSIEERTLKSFAISVISKLVHCIRYLQDAGRITKAGQVNTFSQQSSSSKTKLVNQL
jgi:hypothetical protein